jgi:hypothetical protein
MALTIEEIKKRDREYKVMKRRTDAEWLARERERRRRYGKNRFRNPEKYRQYVNTYRAKEGNKIKEKARGIITRAIREGKIIVPKICEVCRKKPKPFKTNRRPLRADHYKGYQFPLIVRFICVDCDGKQLRSKRKLVRDKAKSDKK